MPEATATGKPVRRMNMGGVSPQDHRPIGERAPKAPFPERGLKQDWTPAALVPIDG